MKKREAYRWPCYLSAVEAMVIYDALRLHGQTVLAEDAFSNVKNLECSALMDKVSKVIEQLVDN